MLPDLTVIRPSGLFDAMYYRINQVDRYENELDPALHYCRFGWWRGSRPNTAFDPAWYAETNAAAVRLGINPLTHYILEGEPANRRPVPWFDPGWYRSQYAVPAGQLALAHYLRERHAGTVSPNPLFDVAWYIARHGASIPSEVDPFSHYLLNGALRDIDPSPRFDARRVAAPAYGASGGGGAVRVAGVGAQSAGALFAVYEWRRSVAGDSFGGAWFRQPIRVTRGERNSRTRHRQLDWDKSQDIWSRMRQSTGHRPIGLNVRNCGRISG